MDGRFRGLMLGLWWPRPRGVVGGGEAIFPSFFWLVLYAFLNGWVRDVVDGVISKRGLAWMD